MSKAFWKAAGARALRTFCQTALAMIPTCAMIQDVEWPAIISTAALASLCSVLTSIYTSLPEVDLMEKAEETEADE